MNLTKFFPAVPILSAIALLSTSATGLCDHRHHYCPPNVVVRPYPSYGYGYGYPYHSGPSFSVSVHRSYAPSYSDDLSVDVQRELRRRGYYRGPIDGDVGPGTRTAIRDYQYSRGLPVTGRIDRNLLHSLGLG